MASRSDGAAQEGGDALLALYECAAGIGEAASGRYRLSCEIIDAGQSLLDGGRLIGKTKANMHAYPPDHPPDDPPVLAAALEYASLGFRVVPLRPRSKKPFIHNWTRHATRDPRVITPWFRRWPTSNIGILTGNGIFALDIDPDNGGNESLRRLTCGHSIPRTAESLTGGGGRHLLFRVPPGVRVNNSQSFRPGIDIRGDDGQIVVEPSIHPDTRREYTWLIHPKQNIAEAPDWLIALLNKAGLWIVQGTCKADWAQPLGSVSAVKEGDADALLVEMIVRFPVEGFGHRNERMVQVLGSLLGRALKPDLAYAVTEAWWRHFYDLGVIRTLPSQAPRAIGAAIRSIPGSPNFRRAYGRVDHLAACRAIQLDAEQQQRLSMKVEDLSNLGRLVSGKDQQDSGECQDREGSTAIWDRLCVSDDERYFVEALIVHVTHERAVSRDGVIRMTGDQARAIAADRHAEVRWSKEQIRRLKDKYVTRDGKPAKRFELLRETLKGERRRGQAIGTPSEYESTGIELLLKPPPNDAGKNHYFPPHDQLARMHGPDEAT